MISYGGKYFDSYLDLQLDKLKSQYNGVPQDDLMFPHRNRDYKDEMIISPEDQYPPGGEPIKTDIG